MPPEGCGGSRVSLFLGLESASLVPEERGEMPHAGMSAEKSRARCASAAWHAATNRLSEQIDMANSFTPEEWDR